MVVNPIEGKQFVAKRILVIDDDPLVLKTITILLRSRSYEVIGCKSGFEALSAVKNAEFDLVISDIRVGDQDGIQTIKKIRDIEIAGERPNTPVIMITGYASQEAPVEAIKLGVEDYFLKPFDNEKLIQSIELHISRSIGQRQIASTQKVHATFNVLGVGIVSPFGFSKEAFWDYINAGKPSRGQVGHSIYPELDGYYCSRVHGFSPDKYYDEKQLHNVEDNSTFVATAAKFAIEDAGIKVSKIGSDEVGVSVGTSVSIATSMSDFEESVLKDGNRRSRIGIFPNTVICAPASRISIFEHITGSNTTISSGMNSGIDAIGYACFCVENNIAKIMLAGGCDALSDKLLLGYAKEGLLFNGSGNGVQKNKRGSFVPSEGACMLVLSAADPAHPELQAYCEILSYVSGFAPSKKRNIAERSDLLEQTLKDALTEARLDINLIDCILISSYFDEWDNDVELDALRHFFGRHLKDKPILAAKKILGESFAAFGPQLIVLAIGLLNGRISPTAARYLNENESFSMPEKIRHILISHIDASGHQSAMIIKSNSQ